MTNQKLITVKGGIIWGWTIRRHSEVFRVVEETELFYNVKPIEGLTHDFSYYNRLVHSGKHLLVPKHHELIE